MAARGDFAGFGGNPAPSGLVQPVERTTELIDHPYPVLVSAIGASNTGGPSSGSPTTELQLGSIWITALLCLKSTLEMRRRIRPPLKVGTPTGPSGSAMGSPRSPESSSTDSTVERPSARCPANHRRSPPRAIPFTLGPRSALTPVGSIVVDSNAATSPNPWAAHRVSSPAARYSGPLPLV